MYINKQELLGLVLETEDSLEKTEGYLDTLNSHLPGLMGTREYTKLQNSIEEITDAYIKGLSGNAIEKAKNGIVGKTWYKKST